MSNQLPAPLTLPSNIPPTIPPPPGAGNPLSSPGGSRNHPGSSPHQFNPLPQNAPGAAAAVGHTLENSIPLSIFPVALDKFAICLSGLPGRGKTHIARRLARYLDFFHAMPVRVFHVADYRRHLYGCNKSAEWFDPQNEEAIHIRDQCQIDAAQDMVDFLNTHANGLAILDSINETHAKRQALVNTLRSTGAKILWLEVVNDDEDFLRKQYRITAKFSPDYEGIDDAVAEADYCKRVETFRAFFETLNKNDEHPKESRWSYMKCDHSKKHFVIHNVKGYLFQKVVNFIMNLRTTSHAFYLTRHGQSEYNDLGRIGGDSGLTEHGLNYARKLAEFVGREIVVDGEGRDVPARLWTSTMRRTKETAQFIRQSKIMVKCSGNDREEGAEEMEWMQMRPRAWHHLDELFAGSCDGMTYEEIEQAFPEEWKLRSVDKLAYRYPRGESYLDVIARLEPIIIEMERHQEPLLIIAHQAILRIIYAFYMGLSRAEAPYVSIPLNTVIKLVPAAYGCAETRIKLYSPKQALPSDGQTEPTGQAASALNDDPQSH